MTTSRPPLGPDAIVECVDAVRRQNPLVHAMTNSVVREISANVLLSIGAAPAMVDSPEEAGLFAAGADGVLVNVGNPSAENFLAYRAALDVAHAAGIPWVLDPVAVGGLPPRTEFAREVLALRPDAIRGNASEVTALAGRSAGGRGVDSTDPVEAALGAAAELAGRTGGVVAVSGERDVVISEEGTTWLTSGHALMPLVIGTGCSLGAAVAAYLGAARAHGLSRHAAVLAAHAHLGAAGVLAGRVARGPGSFHAEWLDAIHALDGAGVAELVTLEHEAGLPSAAEGAR
ncbi:hydroxyethylthiazole kinase [Rothia sp. AR01]|uniref:Hydroxyethylthiazole kinase n=1 Tax=Rothia santali TaxID=2949643 RepID=A0A9X2HD01_9MICC|nr:hydroxyethylthiazole kinase [Rothia santali]MCP3425855.1 hydroxyethylthiazole kinase [Rothia santali]